MIGAHCTVAEGGGVASGVKGLRDALAGVQVKITEAAGHLSVALDLWEESGQALRGALDGTNAPDALDLLGSHVMSADQLTEAWRLLQAAVQEIQRYLERLGVGADAATAATLPDPPSASGPSAGQVRSPFLGLPGRVRPTVVGSHQTGIP